MIDAVDKRTYIVLSYESRSERIHRIGSTELAEVLLRG